MSAYDDSAFASPWRLFPCS